MMISGKKIKFAKEICRENKLREFHFKFVHRPIVCSKELFRFGTENMMTNFFTVVSRILSNTRLFIVISQDCL